jgi:hypothetical protein
MLITTTLTWVSPHLIYLFFLGQYSLMLITTTLTRLSPHLIGHSSMTLDGTELGRSAKQHSPISAAVRTLLDDIQPAAHGSLFFTTPVAFRAACSDLFQLMPPAPGPDTFEGEESRRGLSVLPRTAAPLKQATDEQNISHTNASLSFVKHASGHT